MQHHSSHLYGQCMHYIADLDTVYIQYADLDIGYIQYADLAIGHKQYADLDIGYIQYASTFTRHKYHRKRRREHIL